MKTPDDLKARARTNYQRNIRAWLGGEFSALSFPLSPPTVREAEEDNGNATERWLRQWAAWQGPGEIDYVTKRLGYLGQHELPSRITLGTPEQIARVAGQLADWRRSTARLSHLVAALGEETRRPLLTQFSRWRDWDEVTGERFIAVVRWMRAHRTDDHYVREIPVVGVDTKWIEAHQAVVQAVMGERTFRAKPPLVDLRSLDADLLIRGARRIILELADAAPADPVFSRVLIVENHTTFLALPQLSATVAVWGAGYRADELVAALPWLAERDVHYWGDLDSHGFRILDRLRGRLPRLRSVLMDPRTARNHLELAVEEPTPSGFLPTRLTGEEAVTLALLRERSGAGCLRIEQERIVFTHVVEQLAANLPPNPPQPPKV